LRAAPDVDALADLSGALQLDGDDAATDEEDLVGAAPVGADRLTGSEGAGLEQVLLEVLPVLVVEVEARRVLSVLSHRALSTSGTYVSHVGSSCLEARRSLPACEASP